MVMWQYLSLLCVHFVADFVLQTHWQASNKSKNLNALTEHVLVYTFVLACYTPFIFYHFSLQQWLEFIVLNGVLHFITDWRTSKVASKLFMAQFEDTVEYELTVDSWIVKDMRMAMKKDFNPHYFFVCIGFDQLIHQATLMVTGILIFR